MTNPDTRPYRKRKRARSEEETRRRITEAAVELHGTVGPARTTIAELARRAGVSRMTVYNHFPTDQDIFKACSAHWATENPFPDPAEWAAVVDPRERLAGATEQLFAFYARNARMLENVIRDAATDPALAPIMDAVWGDYRGAVVAVLEQGWGVEDPDERIRPLLLLATSFESWKSLDAAGLDPKEAGKLATDMVAGAMETAKGRGAATS